MWHKLQGGRLCLDFPEFCLRGMTPDFLRSVPSKMLHVFFSNYFTARFISCSDTFVSIYPRLPLSYHESALDPKELQHFCCFNQHFPMGFPMVFLSFSRVFPFSHGFPMISHFPMVFPMVFAHFVTCFVTCGRLRLRPRRQNFGDLSEDASMAAVVAELAQITEEHPYLTLGPSWSPLPEDQCWDLRKFMSIDKYVWLCMYDYVCMIMYVWLCMYVVYICIYNNGMEWNGMLCLIRRYQ